MSILVETYLEDLHEHEIITEGMIGDWFNKVGSKTKQLSTALKNKNINAAKSILSKLPVKNIKKAKADAFKNEPDLKPKYKSNLKKFKTTQDNKLKSSLILAYTASEITLDKMKKSGKVSSNIIGKISKAIDMIADILFKISEMSLSIALLITLIMLFGVIFSLITTVAFNQLAIGAMFFYLSYLMIAIIAYIVKFTAYVIGRFGSKDDNIDSDKLEAEFEEFKD